MEFKEMLDVIRGAGNGHDKKVAVHKLLAEVSALGTAEGDEGEAQYEALVAKACTPQILRECFELIHDIDSDGEKRTAILEFTRVVPKSGAYAALYMFALEESVEAVLFCDDSAVHKKSALTRLCEGVPKTTEFDVSYRFIMENAISVADKIEDRVARRHALVEISRNLMERESLEDVALLARKTALGFAEVAGYKKYSLEEISLELPKPCDLKFYVERTFLGVTFSLPKRGGFFDLYRQAVEYAIKSVEFLKEPLYQKYALIFISEELKGQEQFADLYKQTLTLATDATLEIRDPFPRQRALLDMLQCIPKEEEFFALITRVIEETLPFFTLKSRMDDLEVLDVIDFIIVAEERKMSDSKTKKFTRGNYAKAFARELTGFIEHLNDARLLEIIKPYTHAWVRPIVLRDALKSVATHLEVLRTKYSGAEVCMPVFIKEEFPGFKGKSAKGNAEKVVAKDTISIDLGATNTVIMRKKRDSPPEFVALPGVSEKYGESFIIPTLMEKNTDAIGAQASEGALALNLKKLLLLSSDEGRTLMERYFAILYGHIKEATGQKVGWLARFSGKTSERLCLTVPVGFHGYRKALKEIISGAAKGVEIEFIEEPLAAAIGYQVTEEQEKLFMVLDFGGCTLDIMLLRLSSKEVHVVAKPDRSRMLGGKDIDRWLAKYIEEQSGVKTDHIAPSMLKAAEDIKVKLSEYKTVDFDWLGSDINKITRDDFEEILEEHDFYKALDRELSYVMKKARKVGVTKDLVEAVLLTGGSSQIPSFKDKIAHYFPELAARNAIYDHSPLTAVARGAALYGTSDVVDRHLGMAYAMRFTVKGADKNGGKHYAFEVVLEKGESLPFEKTFSVMPARTLGEQKSIHIELFEVPEGLITRRWVSDGGTEYIKQVLKHAYDEISLSGFKTITLPFDEPLEEEAFITFCVAESGALKVRYGLDAAAGLANRQGRVTATREIDAGFRLQ
jgi:actin-like ATPase involved in cell morphogenesis